MEAAMLAGGDEINENTYYLFVHAQGIVLKTDSTWENAEAYAALQRGLVEHLPGFGSEWQRAVNRRFAQTPHWKQQLFATFYYKDKVVIYPCA
ncbi:hypothetical protein Q5H92_10690 [Hymenobacter sp. M29]|uniref:Uncharacterized protein n=1 Tax=Hymenobacter mellowenesis TaxID=3063995 RepID=A0ABT9AAG2_9BACT|nr:hypothetical protein [Hymenobacter sp. M29]MDO7846825.1 hypothetical protein [Hymenobacter sp. M29]